MTLEQLDQLLADWRKKVDLVGENLIDLYELPTYQRLTGEAGFPRVQLTGMTAARVTPALEAMNELFQHFDLLLKMVERATELRKQVPWFLRAEQKVDEIEQLMTEASIQLPTRQMPLAQRCLLSATEITNEIAPEQLLTIMSNGFQVARDVVLAVEEAWLHLEPTLAEAEADLLWLQKLADTLGQDFLSEMSAARQKITTLRESIEHDPLGASTDFDRELKPLLARVRGLLEQLVRQQRQMRERLETGHNLMKQLVELHRQAETAYAESREKVDDYSEVQTPLAPEKIDALSHWLTRLETKLAEGLMNPVGIGLENWTAKVKEAITTENRTYLVNNESLETRRELRGRLDALKAKALARGLAEDAVLVELAKQTQQLLYTRPTPLDRATELLSQYEKRVNGKLKLKNFRF